MQPIIFYDIPSTFPTKAWSPNPWKTRYALNFKGLPYKTVWVEYPDIASVSKEIGVPPPKDGQYTLPVIHDPNTKTVIADSAAIAQYLDATYPDTPALFPPGTHALQYAFIDAFLGKLGSFWQFAIPAFSKGLNPRSAEYFHRTRSAAFGKPLAELTPTGDKAVEEWAKVKAAYDGVNEWLDKGSKDGPYFLGKQVGFADIVVASFVVSVRNTIGADSAYWKDISSWNDGRWGKLVKSLEKYETVVV